VIEVDGEYHSNGENRKYDDNRSGELERFGIEILRFRNKEITGNIEHVISVIQLKIDELSSPAHPGSRGQKGVRP
jgi:very-short-patch-repair endonuclease